MRVAQTYTLQLLAPVQPFGVVFFLEDDAGAIQRTNGVLRETEENITDLLPEGYLVRIKEWDE